MILGFNKQFIPAIDDGRKVHTIRKDLHGRWQKGMKIHFATGTRTKHYNQFGEGECTGTQRIIIRPFRMKEIIEENGRGVVEIDGIYLSDEEIENLAIRDGFPSSKEFFEWFKDGTIAKIIHWTEFRYPSKDGYVDDFRSGTGNSMKNFKI